MAPGLIVTSAAAMVFEIGKIEVESAIFTVPPSYSVAFSSEKCKLYPGSMVPAGDAIEAASSCNVFLSGVPLKTW